MGLDSQALMNSACGACRAEFACLRAHDGQERCTVVPFSERSESSEHANRVLCRASLSFKDTGPLVIPATFNLTITCLGEGIVINLHSDSGQPFVPENSWLIFEGCEVYTIDDLSTGTEKVAPPALGNNYLGTSLGNVLFRDSRFLFPQQVGMTSHYLHTNCHESVLP